MRAPRPLVAAAALAAALALSACGTGTAGPGGPTTTLTVLAASSLSGVLPRIGARFGADHPGVRLRYSFGGTDQLAAQIEQGAPADLFAGASTTFARRLADEHLIRPWRAFCTNHLVLVVPRSNPAGITSPADLARHGVKLVVGAPGVPVGAYTRTALQRLDETLGPGYARAVLANVVSEEDSVGGVIAKVRLDEADAGFVYVTDARAAAGDVRAIDLPPAARATAVYPVAAVAASPRGPLAGELAAFLLGPVAQGLLREAGFGPPPSS